MSWQVVTQHVDKQLGMHIIHLRDAWSKAHHIVQILIGHDSCPLCGHVKPKTNTGELDPRKIVAQEVAALEKVHSNIDSYSKRHGVPVKLAK
jgi:hypothetical protein